MGFVITSMEYHAASIVNATSMEFNVTLMVIVDIIVGIITKPENSIIIKNRRYSSKIWTNSWKS